MTTTPFPSVPLVRNVRPWGGEASDIRIDENGVITEIMPAAEHESAPGTVDGRGLLAIPGLINAHAHVDKSWWGHPWQSYGGEQSTEGRIRHERERRGELGIPSADITRAVLDQSVRTGTTAFRTHVDVDLGLGLDGISIVRDAFAQFDGALGLQIVAFPQDGVLRRPGVIDLLAQAAAAGVEFIGGLDPAAIDRDPVGQLDALFDIAAEHGCGIDIHLHDGGELGAFELELIAERTERYGLQGRVNVAHGFAIVQIPESRRRDLLQTFGQLDVTWSTVAPLRLPQLPLHEFAEARVDFAFGTDGIRDLWSPYGTGDLLGIAWQYARAGGVVRDEDLRRVVEIASSRAARFVGREVHDLVVGSRADIVLIDAENPMDALVRTPPREIVIGGGRLLHA